MGSLTRFSDLQNLTDPSNLQLDYRQEVDLASDYLNMNNRISFTEYLTDEHYISEAYEFYPPQHMTACSSPESDSYSMFNMEEPKIKIEYTEPIDPSCSIYNVSRTLSQESCPDLAVCNPSSISTSPLTPLDSPHDQSPIMSPTGLSLSHHHIINDQRDIIPEVMLANNNHGRGRRGRRMTNKPAKPGTKSFECHYAGCGRIFKRSEHLKRHIRSIHTLER
ncbi:3236_t:CDS:2, partial [Cetraspora pellucida]